jgi:NAD-dependent SIR2 family protein deacetylase
MSHLDGNAVAGAFAAIFTADLTAAVATCDGCGATGPMATVMLYEGMGEVLRCPECDGVLARVAVMGEETRLDLRGIRVLRLR